MISVVYDEQEYIEDVLKFFIDSTPVVKKSS